MIYIPADIRVWRKSAAGGVYAAFLLASLTSATVLFGEHDKMSEGGLPGARLDAAPEAPRDSASWNKIDSYYCAFYYSPGANLKKMARRLKKRYFYVSGGGQRRDNASVEEGIAARLDALFIRAREILDMKPETGRLKVKVFRNRVELDDEYEKVFGTRPDYKSFYIFAFNTIYTSEEDISDSILVHEMGHAIVDHYFKVIPPEKVRELLAAYVDLHLED
jgi:hypothetical protein